MTESENIENLQKKLKHAQEWMAREIENAEQLRKQEQLKNKSEVVSNELNVTQKIQIFFEDFSPQDLPKGCIENITSSEILYEHMLDGYHLDGTAVIVGYQKVLDILVENKITHGFRSYISEKGISHPPVNNVLEKSFYSIVTSHYILGLGRLYQALQKIKNNKIDGIYMLHFSHYISSIPSLKKALLETDFFLQLEQLVHSDAVGEKRHQGSLNLQDTKKCRELCIGNLYEKNCLIYRLLDTQ